MTQRERFIATMLFGEPDRIPLMPGCPRESTLAEWRRQGMPEDVPFEVCLTELLGMSETFRAKPEFLNDIDFSMLPAFEEKLLEKKESSLIVQDWKGNICEISDEFDVTYLKVPKDFVTRRWIKCPVETRADWEEMRGRYDVETPTRFPGDFADMSGRLSARDYPVGVNIQGPFWQLREWMGFEGLCMALVEQEEFVREMIGFWRGFVSTMLERLLHEVVPDFIWISEDMAYKQKSMISPEMVREFLLPAWREWGEIVHAAGCPIYGIDSDGYIGELIPIWIEAGFQATDPVEVAAGNDLPAYRRQYGNKIAFRGGVDKRNIARGGDDIKREMERLQPVIETGGYIPGCDHGIPPRMMSHGPRWWSSRGCWQAPRDGWDVPSRSCPTK